MFWTVEKQSIIFMSSDYETERISTDITCTRLLHTGVSHDIVNDINAYPVVKIKQV